MSKHLRSRATEKKHHVPACKYFDSWTFILPNFLRFRSSNYYISFQILKHMNFYIFTSWIVWMLRSSHTFAFRVRVRKSEGTPDFLLFLSRNELPSGGGGGGGGCSVALFDCRFNPRYIPWNRRPPIRIFPAHLPRAPFLPHQLLSSFSSS